MAALSTYLKSILQEFIRDSSFEYDLVVIGGGSGGLSCAKEAVKHGAKVAVFDYVTPSPRGTKWGAGGTCVNVGCIPKKLMHYASQLRESIYDAQQYGWELSDPGELQNNWTSLIESVQDHVKSVNWVTRIDLRTLKIDYINAFARFRDANTIVATLEDGSERVVTADKVVIAVGGRPIYPDVPGALEYAISSDDIFSLEDPPGKTCIIGGGYVGLECAGFLTGLGYEVTVLVRSVVLRLLDRQMVDIIKDELIDLGVEFKLKCLPTSIEKLPSGKLKVEWTNTVTNQTFDDEFDTVMYAIGRSASTNSLNLEAAGVVVVPANGKIVTMNEQTNVPNIYAVGDVVEGKPELTPVAMRAGALLAKRLFTNSTLQMDYTNIPSTIFTPIEYAYVGLSEDLALDMYGPENIEIYHAFYKPTEFFIAERSYANCYLKAVALLEDNQKVLGLHFAGLNAGEVIQGFAVAIKCNLTMDVLIDTVGIHPTVAGEFTRLNITKRSGADPHPNSCCG